MERESPDDATNQPEPESPDDDTDQAELESPDNGTVTLVIPKTYLVGAVALIIGLAGGFGIAKWIENPQPPASADATRQVSREADQTLAADQTSAATQQTRVVRVNTTGRPFLGPEDAPVTIVEFTDYQCPFCGRHTRQTLPRLLDEYQGEIRYVIRNFPITSIHPEAAGAAVAAECAHEQGRFWEYHDLLFSNQADLERDSLKRYAVEAGLDPETFDPCLDSNATVDLVSLDFSEGRDYGVTGTPTFFINGQKLDGALPFASFKILIDAALAP